ASPTSIRTLPSGKVVAREAVMPRPVSSAIRSPARKLTPATGVTPVPALAPVAPVPLASHVGDAQVLGEDLDGQRFDEPDVRRCGGPGDVQAFGDLGRGEHLLGALPGVDPGQPGLGDLGDD